VLSTDLVKKTCLWLSLELFVFSADLIKKKRASDYHGNYFVLCADLVKKKRVSDYRGNYWCCQVLLF
jgi:hypothetical protein